MDTTSSTASTKLDEQIVVQETSVMREEITRLRIAYLKADGTKPSESEVMRRIVRAGLPVLFERLGEPF